MSRMTWKGLVAHKRRLIGTALAVILGIGFLATTLVIGDTMRSGFDALFVQANAGTDLVVRNATTMGSDESAVRGDTPADLVDDLTAVPGVAAAVAERIGQVQIEGSDGRPLGGGGPPIMATNWIADDVINPMALAEGRTPQEPGEVVIDRASAEAGNLAVGDTTNVRAPDPLPVEIVGVATFGDHDSMSATTYVAFSDQQAAELLTRPGQVSAILVRADQHADVAALKGTVVSALPDGLEVLTGEELTAEQRADLDRDFLGFVTTILVVFAGIALVVASFSIHNTFSILVAQRARESALLRALGATRGQILGSVALQAVVIGAVASALGLGLGVVLAGGLKALLASAGFELMVSGVVVTGGAVAVSLGVGTVVTVVASLGPAVKASRVAPLEALRSVAVDDTARSKVRAGLGVALTGTGVALVMWGSQLDSSTMSVTGLGAVATLVGAVVLGPVVARPAAAALGAPMAAVRGTSGSIARRNAMRNPKRTSSSAMALLVGVTVVTLFATLGASIKTSLGEIVDRSFGGDLVISGEFGSSGLSPDVTAGVAALDEVDRTVALTDLSVLVSGDEERVLVADLAALEPLVDLGVTEGSLRDMATGGLALSDEAARDAGLTVGESVPVTYLDGTTAPVTVGAVYTETDLLGSMILSRSDWESHAPVRPVDWVVLIGLADGVSLEAGQAAVTAVTDAHGAPEVQTRDQYLDTIASQIDQALVIVYGLLGLAVLIALMGIANTLGLAVHERTRELGLLRAIGQDRRQTGATVRWESVIVAVLGAVGGLVLGTFLGWGLVRALHTTEGFGTFTVPVTQMVWIVALAAGAGVLAAVLPARRAARTDVLTALAAS